MCIPVTGFNWTREVQVVYLSVRLSGKLLKTA
jgi:hypothetical protein